MAFNNSKKSISVDAVEKVSELVTNVKRQETLHHLLADQQLTKESMALAQLLEAINKQKIEVIKASKKTVAFDDDDKEIQLPRTKEQKEAKNKAEERLQKMENAFKKGYEDGVMKDVFELIQQLGGKDKGGGGGNKEGEAS